MTMSARITSGDSLRLVPPGQHPDRPERGGPKRLPFEPRQRLGHGRFEMRETKLGRRAAQVAEVAGKRRPCGLVRGRNTQDLG